MVGTHTLWALGAFRSGTTLLHSLLNAHPDVALIYELNLHERYPLMPASRPGPDWRSRWNRYNHALQRAGLPIDPDPNPPADWETAARNLFTEYAGSQGARYSGEKSPVYAFAAQSLLRNYPDDKFLMLWREPADILRSVRHAAAKSRYFKKPLLDAWFFTGMEQLLRAFAHNPANAHQLSYHQLTNAPEATLAKVWQFLGLAEGQVDPAAFTPAFNIRRTDDLHEPVAAGNVAALPPRAEILTPAERQKVARYRAAWAEEFTLEGKFNEQADQLPESPLTPRERALDRFAARCFQYYNRQIQSFYMRAPGPWLDAYRARRK